jgi:hypothetical protein
MRNLSKTKWNAVLSWGAHQHACCCYSINFVRLESISWRNGSSTTSRTWHVFPPTLKICYKWTERGTKNRFNNLNWFAVQQLTPVSDSVPLNASCDESLRGTISEEIVTILILNFSNVEYYFEWFFSYSVWDVLYFYNCISVLESIWPLKTSVSPHLYTLAGDTVRNFTLSTDATEI